MIEQFTIADILTWLEEKTLVVNREFQRSGQRMANGWRKAYLIDTVLRGLPMPKIYLRTQTDVATKRSFREVVDGQQRLLAIQSFSRDEFTARSAEEAYEEFSGKRYSDLDEELQKKFLGYEVSVEQLFDAPDSKVFDIFQRLNTYNYNLSGQELRHGKFHGDFRNAVVLASRRWAFLWDKYKVIGKRARVRMADDELMAQLFGIVIEGVTDGGQRKIDKLYKAYDAEVPACAPRLVDQVLKYSTENLSDVLETNLAGSPHFLMLFAAVAHALFGIPAGGIGAEMPSRNPRALEDVSMALNNLSTLSDSLDKDSNEVSERFHEFQRASAGTTQRIKSRRARFEMLYKALLSDTI